MIGRAAASEYYFKLKVIFANVNGFCCNAASTLEQGTGSGIGGKMPLTAGNCRPGTPSIG
jgi:hypothetical protein